MSLNTQSLQPIINFLWTVADDVLVNTYQKGKYKDVILPMVVIRRLDLLFRTNQRPSFKNIWRIQREIAKPRQLAYQ